MTLSEMLKIAEAAAYLAICRAHRESHGLPRDASAMEADDPRCKDFPVIDCPEGCAVADTCPLMKWDVSARATVRALTQDDRKALEALEQHRAAYDEGEYRLIPDGLLADLEAHERAQVDAAHQAEALKHLEEARGRYAKAERSTAHRAGVGVL